MSRIPDLQHLLLFFDLGNLRALAG